MGCVNEAVLTSALVSAEYPVSICACAVVTSTAQNKAPNISTRLNRKTQKS